jgi:predicted nucleic acid-binding protein
MTLYLDSSVLVSALIEDESSHENCLRLLGKKNAVAWTYGLTETFATLTGGRLGIRVGPAIAVQLIGESLLPRLQLIDLTAEDTIEALRACDAAGVRGGAIYDFLHLGAARKSHAATLYTLNTRHFLALVRNGDPRIENPDPGAGLLR